METNLVKGNEYLIFTKVNSFVWIPNLKDFITKIIAKLKTNEIIDVKVGLETKKVLVKEVSRYVSTDINGNTTEGIVWKVEPITNPIPVTALVLALEGLIFLGIGYLVYLSLDKVEKIIQTTGSEISKNLPVFLIIGGVLAIKFLKG